ncbi:MAG: Outer rane receptor protein mostly Fe transport [Caulobacteraceae bacterium]|nr:Outer rane receptor protein mostly Fe transport [Caulobacteraceae bacterium]
MKSLLVLGASASALAVGAPSCGALAAEPLSPVVVTASPGIDLAALPTTSHSITAEAIGRTVNLVTPEDALRYLPDVLVRQRHIGDTQSPVTTRTSGVGASARSLIYVDGVLISSLIGNNNTSASPKWGLVAPDAIARVDVLYGPFSAAYAGNSIGSVIAFTTRMPQALEGGMQVQGAAQAFSKYGDRQTYGTGRLAADFGDRRDRFAFRLSYNHLDSSAQPLSYATATVPAATSASGTVVTGAFADANRTGQPIVVLGATGIEHQVQDNVSGRLTYDLTPTLTAAYTFGLFGNNDRSTVNSYLRDAAGAPVYTGSLNIGGRAYTVAAGAFSGGVYRLDELQLAQGLSLASHSGGVFDFELTATDYDYLNSRQRTPATALPAAFSGGAGSDAVLNGTGWYTLDGKGTWRPGGAHVVSFGAHQDVITLNNPRYALADWTTTADGALLAASRGATRTQAVWLQDIWTLTPQLKATVGGRFEHWRAYDGVNYSASPALSVSQPALGKDAFSPKAVLAYAPLPGWTFKGSVGLASRFPTVTELYQAITVGTVLAAPNPNLKPERALSSELSAEKTWDTGSVRLSVFDERITDTLLSQTAALPAVSGAVASYVQNIDATHATGVELVADRRDVFIRGLELSGWVTYVDARIDRDAAFAAAVGKALPQLPRWRGAVVATWTPTPRLDVTLAARYSDPSFATIDNSDHNADTYQGFDGYLVADVHVRYRINRHVTAGIGVDNLNDRSYFLFHPFPQRTLIADLKVSY